MAFDLEKENNLLYYSSVDIIIIIIAHVCSKIKYNTLNYFNALVDR